MCQKMIITGSYFSGIQNIEAALPLGMVQAADPVARRAPLIPESATIGSIPGADGQSAWRDREIWMQSEQGWPSDYTLRMSEAALRRMRQRSRFLHADRPHLACRPEAFSPAIFLRLFSSGRHRTLDTTLKIQPHAVVRGDHFEPRLLF